MEHNSEQSNLVDKDVPHIIAPPIKENIDKNYWYLPPIIDFEKEMSRLENQWKPYSGKIIFNVHKDYGETKEEEEEEEEFN